MRALAAAVPLAAALLAASVQSAPVRDFEYVRALPSQAGGALAIVDARPLEQCRARTLAGARCLPADELLGPQRRLPSARDLLWLLGTAGLAGHETVIVAGQDPVARDFVAGLLHVAGQRRVQILVEPVARLLAAGAAVGAGRQRGFVRETVFEAPMRDRLLVLRDELRGELRSAPALLDGRSDAEYWGERARAARTGHLPGAASLPAPQLRAALDGAAPRPVLPGAPAIAYAHDAYEGFAYLSLLVAGHQVAARLYAEGWAEWAADGALPADAVGYPERGAR